MLLFPKVEASNLKRHFGALNILVGINFASLHPTVPDRTYILKRKSARGEYLAIKS